MKFNELKEFKNLNPKKIVDLNIFRKELTSLEGCPKEVEQFICSKNKLTTLEGSPSKVLSDYLCSYNNLTSLKGIQKEINGVFDCSSNNLKTLEDCPKLIKKYLNCKNNPELKNAKDLIIKYQIKAQKYYTDEGDFTFEDIKEEFEKYKEVPLKIKKNIFINDFGYGI